jgi:dTDP-glucose pyrophosphorylase
MHGPQDELLMLTIIPGQTIREAMACIEQNALRIALLRDAEGRLLGTVSDGDIRRALLQGAGLDDLVDPYVNEDPVTVAPDVQRTAVLDLMTARGLDQIPVVDARRRLLGLHVLKEILGSAVRSNPAVILAGGRGTRLGQLTESMPKPMLSVAGRPILERLVLHLVGSGIRQVFLSVSYLAEQIQAHFGDGSDLGCQIEYLVEAIDQPLGTGGPLRLLRDRVPDSNGPALVLNGDLVASFSVADIFDAHARHDSVMTIALREYAHDVPFGVAALDPETQALVQSFEEKPRWSARINAGIYVVEPQLFERIPPGVNYPITELVRGCLERGERVAGWPMLGEWHDVGRPIELAVARGQY